MLGLMSDMVLSYASLCMAEEAGIYFGGTSFQYAKDFLKMRFIEALELYMIIEGYLNICIRQRLQ